MPQQSKVVQTIPGGQPAELVQGTRLPQVGCTHTFVPSVVGAQKQFPAQLGGP